MRVYIGVGSKLVAAASDTHIRGLVGAAFSSKIVMEREDDRLMHARDDDA